MLIVLSLLDLSNLVFHLTVVIEAGRTRAHLRNVSAFNVCVLSLSFDFLLNTDPSFMNDACLNTLPSADTGRAFDIPVECSQLVLCRLGEVL